MPKCDDLLEFSDCFLTGREALIFSIILFVFIALCIIRKC